jgi:UDP-GlcNAc:undecaprenyl-phosphate GlcNAc-1-phosphate transferase
LLQWNNASANPVLPHGPVFILGIVLIPVFDTLRVFALRMWKGKSPFSADKTHIHHLLTNKGYSHAFAAKLICCIHGFILIEVYWLRSLRQEYILLILVGVMVAVTFLLKNFHKLVRKSERRRFRGTLMDAE